MHVIKIYITAHQQSKSIHKMDEIDSFKNNKTEQKTEDIINIETTQNSFGIVHDISGLHNF